MSPSFMEKRRQQASISKRESLIYKKKHITDSNESEANLLLRYRLTGELMCLGRLYEPYMPLLYGLCLRYLKDEAKAEDAVMQIFEELIVKLKVHEVTNFKSWLYTLARNFCLMQLRREQKTATVSIEDNFVESDSFSHLITKHESASDREETLQLMEKCLYELKPEHAQCLRLFYLEEKRYQEVAELTGFSMAQVKSYIQNGKRNLKICMEKHRDES